ncbi:transposase [Streptomyces minutiscleroticus]
MRIERVDADPESLRITAFTSDDARRARPGRDQEPDWVHSRYVRHVADESVGGCPVVIDLSVRRLYCENPACPRTTFVEQVDGLTERYQRGTPTLRRIVEAVAVVPAGSAGARLLAVLHQRLSSASVLNCLMRVPLPGRPTPVVAGIDEFALLRGHRYATVITNADNGERIDVLPDRQAGSVTAWLRGHPGMRVMCRDGSGSFA